MLTNSTSDHSCLAWQNWFPRAHNKNDTENIANCSPFYFALADYNKLRNYLSDVDWFNVSSAYDPMDIKQLWLAFKNILFDAISVSVPVNKPLKTTKQYFYPKYLRNTLNKKKALKCKHSSSSDGCIKPML